MGQHYNKMAHDCLARQKGLEDAAASKERAISSLKKNCDDSQKHLEHTRRELQAERAQSP